MKPRQFDLGPLRDQSRPRFDRKAYTTPSRWKKRVGLYAIALLVSFSLFFWGRGQAKAVSTELNQNLLATVDGKEDRFLDYLTSSQVSSVKLTENGVRLLEGGQSQVASIILQAASQKDPKFRDAAVYAGFSLLSVSDLYWESNGELAATHTRAAIRYLEMAAVIDPIHSYTYELLTLAHNNLGEEDEAKAAEEKAEAFAFSKD